uniref:Rab-GAP TBC domain-containing protein n=1 Tax=Pavo cristatus TaxID=9049 RepID=A0A8C9G738_PAVCR
MTALTNSLNGLSLMGVLSTRAGGSIQGLQNLKSPRSLSLPEYGPGQHSGVLEDCHSLKSVDSGIPTLEVGNPEPVHCNVLTAKRKQSEPEIVPDRTFQSACTLPSCAPPRPLASEHHAVRKSSTFPRTGYDTVKLYSPTSKTLNRSDDISVCSVSSLSTELSTTLSVSNEDILDFVVTSSSSAIVTLETDEAHFSDVTLSSTKETGDQGQQDCCQETDVDSKRKILGPFTNFLASAGREGEKRSAAAAPQLISGAGGAGRGGRPARPCGPGRRRDGELGPGANLPAKPAEEAQKHRQQYEEMVVQAKKRELKEAQKRKKQLEERCKLEDSIGNAVLTWNNEILPNWETMCCSRKVRELWWQGIPPSVRGKVWSLAIGNELNITHELYDICLARAKEKWRSRSTVGAEVECEGMFSFDSIFKPINNRTNCFFSLLFSQMLTYFAAFEVFFEENLPKLFAHFKKNNLTPDIYLIDWIFTLYSKSLPLDLACRVWDVFCRDGEEFLFRTALGILKLYEDILTKMDFIHIAQFLTKLPEDLPSEEFFTSIAAIQMQSRNKKWAQILAALQKDNREVEKGSPSLKH